MSSNESTRVVPRKSASGKSPAQELTANAPALTEPINMMSLEESIRSRAYQLYEERGKIDGFEEEDWAQAEMEILSKQSGKAA